MKANLRHVQYFLAAGFLLILAGLVYWQLAAAHRLLARDDNPRLVIAEQRIRRGNIQAVDGSLLAETVVEADDLTRRHYVYEGLSPVTGYYSLRYGTSGLEDAYDAHLRGTVGPHDGLPGWLAELMHRPAFGEAITATIYLPAQLAAHEAMVQAGGTGAVVVVDADAGELRVMVSEPTFDANQLESHWDELVADPAAPLINRATQGIFPLGELSRLIVMLALAEAGHELPPAADQIPPADLIEPLSGAELAAMAEQLQFDQPLPFALPTEGAPIPTDLPNKVGEVAATPFHIAMVGLALMSGGEVTEPLFVTDPAPAAIPSLRLMSAETAGQVAPYAADLTGLALPEVTGNEPLSWYLGLIDATETQPALVIVVVVSTAELDQAAAQRIGQMTLAAFQAP